jgi:hypothetical protein
MVRYPEKGYINQNGRAEIIYGIKLKINKTDRRNDRYKNRETRLAYKEGKITL